MHYFLCLGGPDAVSIKSTMGHIVPNLFFHLVGFAGHIVHCSASGAQNFYALFFLLRWDQYGLDKKCARSYYAKLVFSNFWDMRVT